MDSYIEISSINQLFRDIDNMYQMNGNSCSQSLDSSYQSFPLSSQDFDQNKVNLKPSVVMANTTMTTVINKSSSMETTIECQSVTTNRSDSMAQQIKRDHNYCIQNNSSPPQQHSSLMSLKLVPELNEEGYGQNYCTGICRNKKHQKNRYVLTIDEFIQSNDQRFKDVLSIDISCLEVGYELVDKIITLCPKVECLVIIKCRFEIKAWIFLFDKIGHKLIDLTIGNIISFVDSEEEYPNIVLLFKRMFKMCKNINEIKVILFNNGYNYTQFANIFKFLSKNVFYIYLRDEVKEERHECSLDCHKTYESYKKSLMHSNLKTIISNIFDRIETELQYLRLESNVCPIKSLYVFKDVLKFKNLRSLNLTFKRFDLILYPKGLLISHLRGFKHLKQIQCLTVGFKKFKTTDFFLQLIDTKEKKIKVKNRFSNLDSLQLCSCTF